MTTALHLLTHVYRSLFTNKYDNVAHASSCIIQSQSLRTRPGGIPAVLAHSRSSTPSPELAALHKQLQLSKAATQEAQERILEKQLPQGKFQGICQLQSWPLTYGPPCQHVVMNPSTSYIEAFMQTVTLVTCRIWAMAPKPLLFVEPRALA